MIRLSSPRDTAVLLPKPRQLTPAHCSACVELACSCTPQQLRRYVAGLHGRGPLVGTCGVRLDRPRLAAQEYERLAAARHSIGSGAAKRTVRWTCVILRWCALPEEVLTSLLVLTMLKAVREAEHAVWMQRAALRGDPATTSPKLRAQLSAAQVAALDEARRRYVRGGGWANQFMDAAIARFLIASNWNVDKAADIFAGSIKMRRELGFDDSRRWAAAGFCMTDCPVSRRSLRLASNMPALFDTKQGDFVSVIHFGSLDAAACENTFTVDQYIHTNVRVSEWIAHRADRRSHEQGRLAGLVVIQDCNGIGFAQCSKSLMDREASWGQICDKVYEPLSVRRLIVVNPPWLVYRAIWPIFRLTLPPHLRETAKVVRGPAEIAAEFRELADMEPRHVIDELPSLLGGNCKAPPQRTRDAFGMDRHPPKEVARWFNGLAGAPDGRGSWSDWMHGRAPSEETRKQYPVS